MKKLNLSIYFLFIALSIYAIFYMVDRFANDELINAWPILPTMVFGSLIAGSTPMGGGVVAFPVMSYSMTQLAEIASFYSLAIQAFGMTAASIIIIGKVPKLIRWDILLIACPIALGAAIISPYLKTFYPQYNLKILFSSFWFGCGIVLYLVRKKFKKKYEKRCSNDF